MLAKELCQKFMEKTLSCIHKRRVESLFETTWSLTKDAKLTLTSLGRYKEGKAQVKHKIKSVDRLLGNEDLHKEITLIYKEMFQPLMNALPVLYIIVDWSGCCGKERHMLRATLMQDGRGITIYNEIHPLEKVGNAKVHRNFLFKLRSIIPSEKNVVIVTDAGFATPWFLNVLKMGWDFVGRITKRYTLELEGKWISALELSDKARTHMTYIGRGSIGKTGLKGNIYTVRQKLKGRQDKSRYPDINKRYAKANRSPWILVSSLSPTFYKPINIKNIYKKRMQIEENFRDDKNPRFGFGWRYSRTQCPNRISILCLIANLAGFLLSWIGLIAEEKGLHKRYQSNTERTKRVLSLPFLAKEVLRYDRFDISIKQYQKTAQLFALRYEEFILCH